MKRVWLERHRPDLEAPPTPDEQHRLDQGLEVGRLAQALFPGGRRVSGERELEPHLARSRAAFSERRPLFEAAFATERAYARSDVLAPSGATKWHLIEVKSATGVYTGKRRPRLEPRFADDVAFQLFVAENAGLEVESVAFLHLNPAFRRGALIEPERLFSRVDVTAEARAGQRGIVGEINEALALLDRDDPPDVSIGAQCEKPYACPFMRHCWSDVPDDSVHTLYRGGRAAHRLWGSGHRTLLDIPREVPLTRRQRIQIQAVRQRGAVVDVAAIERYLDRLVYPLHFLDFETFSAAIPPYRGVRPYQQIPFQFSLHVLPAPDAAPVHHEFLALDAADPRDALLDALREPLGKTGSIVSYNAPFEQSRLEEMADAFMRHAPWIRATRARFEAADLLLPFRNFSYYHPGQRGSASIKHVLPVMTSLSYAHLPIANGAAAASEFRRITTQPVPAAEAARVRQDLLKYCGQDTLALVQIYRRLRKIVAA